MEPTETMNGKEAQEKEQEQKQDSLWESNEVEKSKIGIMRALVEREDPSSKVGFTPPSYYFSLSHFF